jgi:hypothetical protein
MRSGREREHERGRTERVGRRLGPGIGGGICRGYFHDPVAVSRASVLDGGPIGLREMSRSW